MKMISAMLFFGYAPNDKLYLGLPLSAASLTHYTSSRRAGMGNVAAASTNIGGSKSCFIMSRAHMF